MSYVEPPQCEYPGASDLGSNVLRQCRNRSQGQYFGRYVCSRHREAIVTEVRACQQCGRLRCRWHFPLNRGRLVEYCDACIDEFWPGQQEFRRCTYCDKLIDALNRGGT